MICWTSQGRLLISSSYLNLSVGDFLFVCFWSLTTAIQVSQSQKQQNNYSSLWKFRNPQTWSTWEKAHQMKEKRCKLYFFNSKVCCYFLTFSLRCKIILTWTIGNIRRRNSLLLQILGEGKKNSKLSDVFDYLI